MIYSRTTSADLLVTTEFIWKILTPIKFVQAIKKQPNFLITTVVKDRSNVKNENKNEKIDSEKVEADQIK